MNKVRRRTKKSASVDGEEWHRVRIGPYKNKSQLSRSMNLLQKHNIIAMAMEIKP
jgi:cell division protein FtsN